MSSITVSPDTTVPATTPKDTRNIRTIRHVRLKKRFFCPDTLEHIEPGQAFALFQAAKSNDRVFEVLTPGGARACFARSEVDLPTKPTEAGQFAFDALCLTLRPIIDLADTMDDADRRRIGYSILAELNVRSMTVADLLHILNECNRIAILRMSR